MIKYIDFELVLYDYHIQMNNSLEGLVAFPYYFICHDIIYTSLYSLIFDVIVNQIKKNQIF